MEPEPEEEVGKIFEAACRHVRGLAAAGGQAKEDLLYFYARYKQAQEGPCKTAKPAFYQLTERSKWQAWADLGTMDRELAVQQYLDRLDRIDPEWRVKDTKEPTSGWVSVSCPKAVEEDILPDREKTLFDWTKEGRLDKLQVLLDSGNVGVTDPDGLTLLHWAADRGLREVAQLILQIGPSLVNIQDVEGQTALHYACNCGHIALVKLLLESGADASILDTDGNTPLTLDSCHDIQDLLSNFA